MGSTFISGDKIHNSVQLDPDRPDVPPCGATHFNNHTPSEEDAWKIQPEDIGEMVVHLLKLNSRTLPSKIEVRPSMPPKK